MAIYTKTGDQGETSLANGERISKTDSRIEAYGTVDELNSWVGMLRAALNAQNVSALTKYEEQLAQIQNKLFNLGAGLSEAPGEWISDNDVKQMESWIDAMQSLLPQQHAFILPMGSQAVTSCHVCRTVCRRAERRMIEANSPLLYRQYINRLSDYLFVLSRAISYQSGEAEHVWKN
jgi:cob(I)alamin adenosyltransferase